MDWFRRPRHRKDDVFFFEYEVATKTLIVTLEDGLTRTHYNVGEGYVIGLHVALDKFDFYQEQIAMVFPYIETSKRDAASV